MRKSILILTGILTISAGCLKVEDIDTGTSEVHSVSFTIDPFMNGDEATKTSFWGNGAFYWAEHDTVGVYPNTGSQVYFAMTSGAGASTAEFDGGGWAFKSASTYYSYYPFIGDIYLNRTHIPVSYRGQKQTGTTQRDHIGPYDFMYTSATPAVGGIVSFGYHHLSCIIDMILTLPAGTYTKLAITAPSSVFTMEGYYNLTSADPSIVPTQTSRMIVIDLEGITLTSQTSFDVYLLSAPVDLKGVQVTVSVVNGEETELQCYKTPSKSYLKQNLYGLTCNSWTEVPQTVSINIGDWEQDTHHGQVN